MTTSPATNALDVNALGNLKRSVKAGDADANHKVAQQFEGLFLSMMLKNMRASLPGGDPLDSDQVKMVTGMYDDQIAQSMAAGKGVGLGAALEKQLNRSHTSAVAPGTGSTAMPLRAPAGSGYPLKGATHGAMNLHGLNAAGLHDKPGALAPSSAQPSEVHVSFVEKYKTAAIAASQASGVPAKLILGQAALESGWGKHEVKDAHGEGSYNLFGIKAGSNWNGPTVEAATTEYVNGVAQKVMQKFRAYSSYAESFMDYAKMVANSPRYAQAMGGAGDALGFAIAMGRSGYATDPAYGQKLAQVINGPLRDLV